MKRADINEVSAFSVAFAKHFRDWATERELTQVAIAKEMDRTQAWVSERLRGVRPVDTDLISAVAKMGKSTPREVVASVIERIEAASRVTRMRPRKSAVGKLEPKAARRQKDPDA